MQKSEHVSAIILETVKSKLLLSLGILVAVAGAIATSLFPPLILGKIIDSHNRRPGRNHRHGGALFSAHCSHRLHRSRT